VKYREADRGRAPVPERATPVETDAQEETPTGSLEHLLQTVGNHLLTEALLGLPMEGLGPVVAGDVGGAMAGLSDASLPSNSAMRRALDDGHIDWGHPSLANLGSRAGGYPLPADQRARLDAAFGHDFSHVRVHTDDRAAQAAERLSAHAFALGADLYFGRGTWAPGSTETDRLLAHELTHVVQHERGRLGGGGGGVSSPSEPTEREAYANEDRITSRLRAVDASVASEPREPTTLVARIGQSRGKALPAAVAARVSATFGEAGAAAPEPGPGTDAFDRAAEGLGASAWRSTPLQTPGSTGPVLRKARVPTPGHGGHDEANPDEEKDEEHTWAPGELVTLGGRGTKTPAVVVDPFLGGHQRGEHEPHEGHHARDAHHREHDQGPVTVRTIGENSHQKVVKPDELEPLSDLSALPLSKKIAPGARVWARIAKGYWTPGIVFGTVPAGHLVQLLGPSGAVETLPDACLSLTPRTTTARFALGQIVKTTAQGTKEPCTATSSASRPTRPPPRARRTGRARATGSSTASSPCLRSARCSDRCPPTGWRPRYPPSATVPRPPPSARPARPRRRSARRRRRGARRRKRRRRPRKTPRRPRRRRRRPRRARRARRGTRARRARPVATTRARPRPRRRTRTTRSSRS